MPPLHFFFLPEQTVQPTPPKPHALGEVPDWQVLLLQQPAQLPAPHGAAWQLPALQVAPAPRSAVQFWQTPPPLPHWVALVVVTHWLPLQQPFAHGLFVPAPQPTRAHVPAPVAPAAMQTAFGPRAALQLMQAPPLVPHSAAFVPATTQVLPLQQPVVHGLTVFTPHTWPAQVENCVVPLQMLPPVTLQGALQTASNGLAAFPVGWTVNPQLLLPPNAKQVDEA